MAKVKYRPHAFNLLQSDYEMIGKYVIGQLQEKMIQLEESARQALIGKASCAYQESYGDWQTMVAIAQWELSLLHGVKRLNEHVIDIGDGPYTAEQLLQLNAYLDTIFERHLTGNVRRLHDSQVCAACKDCRIKRRLVKRKTGETWINRKRYRVTIPSNYDASDVQSKIKKILRGRLTIVKS